jgi:hypothetical protein
MNAQTSTTGTLEPTLPRFDRKFIEAHQLIERYLENKLPLKGARELEHWCRAHPEYLEELNLGERAAASLKLLEASGQPVDLREPQPPWWRTIYFLIGLGFLTLVSFVAFWAMLGKYEYLTSKLEDARAAAAHGTMSAPVSQRSLALAPDHAPGIGAARVTVSHGAAELVELRIDMSYSKNTQFRVAIDKRDQGRALLISNLLKDSNGDVKIAFNTSALAPGLYDVRVEGLPPRGAPIEEGWLVVDAH